MKHKLIYLSLVLLLFINVTSALDETYQQGKRVNLILTCRVDDHVPSNSATMNVTISSVKNGTILVSNKITNASGQGVFNYSYTFNDQGIHKVTSFCYDGILNSSNDNYIEVTPSGNSGVGYIVFSIFILLLIYGITFIGFFGRSIPITILGGMCMIFYTGYLVLNGIVLYRDDLTNYIAYITGGIGITLCLMAFSEWIN